jgi:hypothetical protein
VVTKPRTSFRATRRFAGQLGGAPCWGDAGEETGQGRGAEASLAMALITGLGFGAVPARKASLLPPIRALGTE